MKMDDEIEVDWLDNVECNDLLTVKMVDRCDSDLFELRLSFFSRHGSTTVLRFCFVRSCMATPTFF